MNELERDGLQYDTIKLLADAIRIKQLSLSRHRQQLLQLMTGTDANLLQPHQQEWGVAHAANDNDDDAPMPPPDESPIPAPLSEDPFDAKNGRPNKWPTNGGSDVLHESTLDHMFEQGQQLSSALLHVAQVEHRQQLFNYLSLPSTTLLPHDQYVLHPKNLGFIDSLTRVE
jgi:hypothetical protein